MDDGDDYGIPRTASTAEIIVVCTDTMTVH